MLVLLPVHPHLVTVRKVIERKKILLRNSNIIDDVYQTHFTDQRINLDKVEKKYTSKTVPISNPNASISPFIE